MTSLVSRRADPTMCTRTLSVPAVPDFPLSLKVNIPRVMNDDESRGKEYVCSFASPITAPCLSIKSLSSSYSNSGLTLLYVFLICITFPFFCLPPAFNNNSPLIFVKAWAKSGFSRLNPCDCCCHLRCMLYCLTCIHMLLEGGVEACQKLSR